jgi:hypothetical protein
VIVATLLLVGENFGPVFFFCFFFHICDAEILANFASEIAKLLKITLKKKFEKFPDFLVKKKQKFSPKKETLLGTVLEQIVNKCSIYL